MKLPFVFLSRRRWDDIQSALAAWPKLVEQLTNENVQLKGHLLDLGDGAGHLLVS
ncbi:hypothetical protein [Phenylobacterium sp.]|uniref:hypothetical protein n=1 Tax=Phenylobacterium sp. TaxID=1871053 RepID=UPI002737E4C9|nr:hypothetical protein [Phenylobacterium sp.]MDP3869910.1 hypothetical protein [Phenylobacterium sp.]